MTGQGSERWHGLPHPGMREGPGKQAVWAKRPDSLLTPTHPYSQAALLLA